ncbi:MAG: glycine--tRNA ligase, partial [Oscillospiraceae bacterium]|nr:glycine--tRNA ligase [Oscillospiraceae bacterium]
MKNTEKSMDKIVALCKGRGFVYQNSEIYGGLANTWDYGPLGALLKANIKSAWLKKFVQESRYNVALDSAILMNPQTWVASGHLAGFSDPLISCKSCRTRHRADNLIEDFDGAITAGWTDEQLMGKIIDNKIPCPKCGKLEFTDIKKFNLMFKTFQGITEDTADEIYLRPETAQGIFVNFANIARTTRRKIPFGVAQIGKSFRNEVTPGKFIFRVREFEQMELEFFCKPDTDLEWFDYWKTFCHDWLKLVGLKEESLRLRDHDKDELSFYSKATTDFEFLYPFGWGELWGIADRTDYDLKQHINESGKSLEYFDPETNEKYIPYVIEPSLGVERLFLALLTDAYDEEALDDAGQPVLNNQTLPKDTETTFSSESNSKEAVSTRNILRLHPYLAPVKAAVLPLSKKLGEGAQGVFDELCKHFYCEYDDTG